MKILNIFSVSIVNTPLKLGNSVIHKMGDVTECFKSLRQVPDSIFHIRTVDPEAVKAKYWENKQKFTLHSALRGF